jgi:pyruvate dehydrogenase E2 component (dihydrolipoamide acetyltransferase)
MSFEFFLPKLGEGISSGTVIALSFKDGDKVKKDDPILEIETDKAAMGLPSPVDGVIVKYCVKEGADVKTGDLVAIIETSGVVAATITKEKAVEKTEPVKPVVVAKSEPVKTVAASLSSAGSANEFRLPPLGEGIKAGNVLSLYVGVGSQIKEGDPIFEIETDKAAMSIPSPFTGQIQSLNVKEGKEIKIGDVVAVILTTGAVAQPVVNIQPKTENKVEIKSAPISEVKSELALVYKEITIPILDRSKKVVRAGPATRKFARELGVDLTLVSGTKRQGRIDVIDIKAFVKESLNNPAAVKARSGGVAKQALSLPDFSKFGTIRREPLTKIRKIISERMTNNWNNIPHVFQFQDIDITGITEVGKKFTEEFKEKGSTASPTNFFIKAMVNCLQAFPKFNSSIDEVSGELIYKEYFNIGVAVDTPVGLIVPVLRNVDKMSIFEIGKNLREIAAKGRERKITPDEMTGSCLTLSNLGGIGGTSFTPIVNWPEVAIIGIAKAQIKPVYIDGAFVPRSIVTICLSYDHRVIDGADAARFVVKFKDLIENYEKTLMGAV